MAAPKVTVAASLEQQVLEVAGELQSAETADLALETPTITSRRASVTPNFTAGTVSISVTLPITVSVDADGGMSFDVAPYLA